MTKKMKCGLQATPSEFFLFGGKKGYDNQFRVAPIRKFRHSAL
ncbi:MAG: hypothetical protein Q7N95_17145 [Alphaproteobacteria bacterium]|nr:hypothetical protein [Alphaproteobacteria bacterium]